MITVIIPEKEDLRIIEKNVIFIQEEEGQAGILLKSFLVVKDIYYVSINSGYAVLLDANKKQYHGDDSAAIEEAILNYTGEDFEFI